MSLKGKIYEIYTAACSPIRFAGNLIDSPAIILIYHRVAFLENDPQLLAVKPDNFYRQVEWLKNKYNIITLEELGNHLKNGSIQKRSVVITFDDGYADNYLGALPVLEALSAHATFFITTNSIGSEREFWWDDLERVFLNDVILPPSLLLEISGKTYQFDTSTPASKLKTYNKLHPILKFRKSVDRDDLIRMILDWSGLSYKGRETHRPMTIKEVSNLSKSEYTTIGAHTQSHTPLSILSKDEQQHEIIRSKMQLEEWTNTQIKHFSYPFGSIIDYDKNSVAICEEENFCTACSNFYSQVHSWSNRYELPRCLIRDWDFEFFKNQINKFFRY